MGTDRVDGGWDLAVGVDPPNDPNIGVAYLKPLMCDVIKG